MRLESHKENEAALIIQEHLPSREIFLPGLIGLICVTREPI